MAGTQGRKGRRSHNSGCLLACSSWLSQLTFFYRTQDHQKKGGTPHQSSVKNAVLSCLAHRPTLARAIYKLKCALPK